MKAIQVAEDSADQEICWALVGRNLPLFRVSSHYVPEKQFPPTLAIFAFLASIEDIFIRVSDESVALAKLAWWARQFEEPEFSTSTHPVIRRIRRTGAVQPGGRILVRRMLLSAIERIDAPPPADEDELKVRCVSIGKPPLSLELSLYGDGNQVSPPLELAALSGLVHLLRVSSRKKQARYAWLPLNLLARHGLTRQRLKQGVDPETARKIFIEICGLGRSWIDSEFAHPGQRRSDAEFSQPGSGNDVGCAHCLIHGALNFRILGKLQTLSQPEHRSLFDSARYSDVFFVWRTARKAKT